MGAEEYEDEMARLRHENAELARQNENLIRAFQRVFPEPTPEELAAAEANVGGLRRVIDELSKRPRGNRDGG